jgi:hypothetical protein
MDEERRTLNDDPHRVVYVYGETPPIEEPPARKGLTRVRRLIGAALLAFILVGAALIFAPSLLKRLSPKPPVASPAKVAQSPVDPESLPAVPVAWGNLDLSTMPAEVVQDLKSGKYYYDNRFPGNFGLAIKYWNQALTRLSGIRDSSQSPIPDLAGRDGVQALVASAEQELARQFNNDSGDVVVLLKQRKKDQALILLEKMRADFRDIAAPQYKWASATLSRQRR